MRKQDLERTHRGIIKVASELFMEKGFKATSTREIAQRCQITQPNLYHHFKNKNELYIAVMEDLTDTVRVDLAEIVESTQTLTEKLTQMMDVLIMKHPANLFMLLHDIYNEMEETNQMVMYKMFKTTYINMFMKIFDDQAKEQGLREGVTSESAARFVLYNVSAMLGIQNTYRSKGSKEQITQFVDFMLNGLV